MAVTWALALLLSFGLRLWGFEHPAPFVIRPFLVLILLFGPSIALGFWVMAFGFRNKPID